MRPVLRGACPQDEHAQDVVFKKYTHARRDLIDRLGEYCSYCEMHLDASLAVEHVQPKKPPGAENELPERTLNWANFLLACTNCNSTKLNTEVVLSDYLWPDRDNTFHSLHYSEGGIVQSAAGPQQTQAQRLMKLVGLDKMPDPAAASDRRWQNRREAWDMAERAKGRLAACQTDAMKDQIMDTAREKGFWSVWMTVFANDADMQARLIKEFSGTRAEFF